MAFNAQTINPINLNPNIGVGINIPFNNAGPGNALFYTTGSTVTVVNNGVFTLNYNTRDAIKNNLINYFLTNPGELPLNPNFGAGSCITCPPFQTSFEGAIKCVPKSPPCSSKYYFSFFSKTKIS